MALGLAGPPPFAPPLLGGGPWRAVGGPQGIRKALKRRRFPTAAPPAPRPGDAVREQWGQDRPAWSLPCPPDPLLALLRFPCPTHEGLFPSLAWGPHLISPPHSCEEGRENHSPENAQPPFALSRQIPTSLQANDLTMSLTSLRIQEWGGRPGPTLPIC